MSDAVKIFRHNIHSDEQAIASFGVLLLQSELLLVRLSWPLLVRLPWAPRLFSHDAWFVPLNMVQADRLTEVRGVSLLKAVGPQDWVSTSLSLRWVLRHLSYRMSL